MVRSVAFRAPSWLVLAIIGLFLTACSQSNPVALLFNKAPWQSGEQSTYAIVGSNNQPAGYMTYSIGDGADGTGRQLWVIERLTESLGDTEIVATKMEADGFRPTASYLERTNADGTESVDAQYSGSQVDLTLTTKQQVITPQREQIPSDAREYTTLPMIIRALPLEKGYATQLNTFLPVAALLDRVTLNVSGEEAVTVPAGIYDTWVVDLKISDVDSQAWIGKSPPHPLVKYYDARNRGTYELTEFRASE